MAFCQRCAEHPVTLLTSLGLSDAQHLFPHPCPDPVWSASTTVNRWNLLSDREWWGGREHWCCGEKLHTHCSSPCVCMTCWSYLHVANTETEVGLGEVRFCRTPLVFLRTFLRKARVDLKLMCSKLCSRHQRFLKVRLKLFLNTSIKLGLTRNLISGNIL